MEERLKQKKTEEKKPEEEKEPVVRETKKQRFIMNPLTHFYEIFHKLAP